MNPDGEFGIYPTDWEMNTFNLRKDPIGCQSRAMNFRDEDF